MAIGDKPAGAGDGDGIRPGCHARRDGESPGGRRQGEVGRCAGPRLGEFVGIDRAEAGDQVIARGRLRVTMTS